MIRIETYFMQRNLAGLFLILFKCILLAWPPTTLAGADPFSTEGRVDSGALASSTEYSICQADKISKPLTLADVVDLALCNNPQTTIQWATWRAQAAQLGFSKSTYLPILNGVITAENSRSAAGASASSDQTSMSVTASYLLYDFGGRAASVENASQLLVAVHASRDAALQNIFLNAVQAYYTLLSAQASVAAYQSAEAAAEKSLQAAQARYQAGVATLADRLQAKTALSQATLNRIRAVGEATNAQGALLNVMGFAVTQALELSSPASDAVAEQNCVVEQDIGKLITQARLSRPELQAAEAQIKAAEAQLAAANASGLPSINLNGSLGKFKVENMASTTTQKLGISLSVPLFSGFKNTYQTKTAQAQLTGKVAERDRMANQVALEVWKAYQSLLTNSQGLRAADDLLASAEQSEKMVAGRYQAGLGNILDVLTAQSTLASARQQQIAALYTFKVSKFVLAQAIGQLDLTILDAI